MTRKIVSLDTIVQITIAAKVRKRKTQYWMTSMITKFRIQYWMTSMITKLRIYAMHKQFYSKQ